MTIVRWDPFRDMTTLQDRVNRLFGDVMRSATDDSSWGNWVPPVDIFEKEDCLVLKAELPGMKEKDIDINVENGVLSLKGERRREAEVKNENYHRTERYYGTFVRTFALPTMVDVARIRATYKDGVLEVVLPKAETAKPKRIEIKTT
jgi:HSP20 family protein